LPSALKELPGEIEALREQGGADRDRKLAELTATLKRYEAESRAFTQERFDTLSPRDRALHLKAFCDNAGDPAYRHLVEMAYRDGAETRRMTVPKGDLLYQFRKDVADGTLPTVSWIVAPEKLSDHPSSAWYGAWYLAEVLDILTRNPAVWKKTVFLLTYDENDGYFDHVPPFVPPHPGRPETGRVSPGIDTSVEYVELAQDRKFHPRGAVREGPIGLGYRVPLVIASPWSRGGVVCSQVFDHTSPLQFLEKWLSHKTGKKVEEPNISRWRRTVCGNLLSAFQAATDAGSGPAPFPPRDKFLQQVHNARFKKTPDGFHSLSTDEIEQLRRDPRSSLRMPRQEPGQRRSAPLPYQLAVDGALDGGRFVLHVAAGKDVFGDRSAGAPFTVYAFAADGLAVRNYAVEAGERIDDAWPLAVFENGQYRLRAYGPNGFFREFVGGDDPPAEFRFDYAHTADGRSLTGGITIEAANNGPRDMVVEVCDNSYGAARQTRKVSPGGRATVVVETAASHGWYDVTTNIPLTSRSPCDCRIRNARGRLIFVPTEHPRDRQQLATDHQAGHQGENPRVPAELLPPGRDRFGRLKRRSVNAEPRPRADGKFDLHPSDLGRGCAVIPDGRKNADGVGYERQRDQERGEQHSARADATESGQCATVTR
jgi:phospholipase C